MGPLFALGFLTVAALIVALPCVLFGAWLAKRVSRRSSEEVRREFVRAGVLIPIGGVSYGIGCIVAIGIFGTLTGRDLGFGDSYGIPLNNGYHWSAIDEGISGCVFPEAAEDASSSCGLPNLSRTRFVDVLSFQESGDWLAGSFDSDESHFLYPDQQRSDHWFLFNTKTHERYDAPNEAVLARLSVQHGFTLKLESAINFYDHHRYRWYDGAFALLLLAPGLLILLRLYARARRLLKKSAAALETGASSS